jgi:flavin-binding protein dodecin
VNGSASASAVVASLLRSGVPAPQSIWRFSPELIGGSTESWEQAAKSVVAEAAKHLRELRIAEVAERDLVIENGKVVAHRE